MNRFIIIAERGWVFVGKVTREGDQLAISECHNVRRWGTASGLGELALDGPQDNTTMDFYGTVRVHVLAVVGQIECNEDVWAKWEAKQSRRRSKS